MQKKYVFTAITIAILSVPLFVFAESLVPCGGPTQDPCSLCDLYVLAQNVMDFLMWQAVPIIAIFAFSWAGFKILISGTNPGLRSEGFGIIRKTIIGVVIVFSSWIIVNEMLLFFSSPQGATTGTILSNPWNKVDCVLKPSEVIADEILAQHQQVMAQFTTAGVTVTVFSSAGKTCTTFNGPQGCTTLAQLPQNAINGIIALAKGCGCALTITGGTEIVGHTTHGPGIPAVDIQKNPTLDAYILSIAGTGQQTSLGIRYTAGGVVYLDEVAINGQGAHWHIVF